MSEDWTDTGLTSRGWFKPAVALWFALLLGGGLFLMPSGVHTSIAQATGLGGRALVSALAAVFGGFLGLAVAGRIAQATAPRAIAPGLEPHDGEDWSEEPGEEEEPRRRRVFSAREDIGMDGIGTSEIEAAHEEPARAFEEILADIPETSETASSAEETLVKSVAIEDAEFEAVEEGDAAELGPGPTPESSPVAMALGDLSLPQLEERLAAALERRKRAVAAGGDVSTDQTTAGLPVEDETESELQIPDDDDPVIAFLRREASRKMPQNEPSPPQRDYDAQAALRQALDKLGKVGKPND